jgi:hypothetical protein
MKKHSPILRASTLLILLSLAGCGGGGGGGGGNGASANSNGNNSPSLGNGPALSAPTIPENETDHSVSVSTGSAVSSSSVAWLPPTQNVDNSAFTDLVGYKIYIGSEPGRFKVVRELKEPGLTEYVLESLPAGKYYVGMTAVNSQNIESPLSNVVVRVVDGS